CSLNAPAPSEIYTLSLHHALPISGHDFLTIADLSSEQFQRLIDAAQVLKQARRAPWTRRLLEGRTLAMIFAKPSTRTRVSFEVRSEEHTSELQSREKLVCRLLLEK